MFSQSVFELSGNFRTIKKEKLNAVKSLNDIITNYPSNWISSYKSVEITATNNGIQKFAVGINNMLTEEQKFLLNSADLLSSIKIKVKYDYNNPTRKKTESHEMEVLLYISPDSNAKFDGGQMQMQEFLKQSILGNAFDTIPRRLGMVVVKFTVNEQGDIINSKIAKSCGDLFTDMRLIQAINRMPKWKPAEHKGVKIAQEFQFSFGGC